MKVTIEEITVKKAQEWLKRNLTNRPIRQGVVERYADMIKRGQWVENGDAIRFDCDGNVIDGQHRLYAVIMAGLPIVCVVARGLDPKAFDSIDRGAMRTMADVFHRNGVENAKTMAAAVRVLAFLDLETPSKRMWVSLSADDAKAILQSNPGLGDSVASARRAQKVIPAATGTALHYRFRQKDDALAESFFEALATGENLKKGEPVFRLRERMMDRGRGIQVRSMMVLALTIKAWNATRKGRQLQSLLWRTDEVFPGIE